MASPRSTPDPERRELTRAWLSYRWRAIGFAYCGHWPTYRGDPRYRTVANARPPDPPQHLTAAQIEHINRWLNRRGYTIIKGAVKLSVVRTV